MAAFIETQWRYHDLRVVRLENELLRLDILPELGAKIYNLIHKPADRNLLWHNPRIMPHRTPFGANFDNHWAGGWDEPFPNGAECVYAGETLPYLGELWAQQWEWEVLDGGPQRAQIHLWCDGPITPARVEKTITLAKGSGVVRFDHRITNTGTLPFDFNWGIHPAFAVTPDSRIDLPACQGVVEEAAGEVLGEVHTPFTWPSVLTSRGERRDLRFPLSRQSGAMSFSYLEGFEQGWLAITDRPTTSGLGLAFPREVFRCLWLYLCFGGYRDLNVAIVEPWIGYPSKLSEAVQAGRFRTLAAGESLEATLSAVAYTGVQSVSFVGADGEVRP
ncbi:MAG TPA: hypothetical protein VJO32_10275 [Ktedonobacteraceae bacterium]|nr:hypothetical protein [Ktedonobacteraceae bacterium]